MTTAKRIIALMISAVLVFANAFTVYAENESEAFERFLKEEYVRLLEESYTTMHDNVRDYEAYGITKPEPVFPDASWESFEEEANRCQDALDRLHQFDYEKLTDEQKTEYECYEFYLESVRDLNSYPQCSGYFEPGSGEHDNITTVFTEFKFYRAEDVPDYLSLLRSVPAHFEEAIDVTKRQAELGYFMTDGQLDETKEEIAELTAKKEDNQLIVIFEEQMDSLDFLSEAEKAEYKRENREIVLSEILPCFDQTAAELEKLRGSRSFEGGLCNYPNGGKEYYEALVRFRTGMDDPIETQTAILRDYLMSIVNEYIELMTLHPDAEDKYASETVAVKTPDDILEYLKNHLDQFPEGPEVRYTCSYLDPSVAKESTVAYYLIPPIDDITDNVIRINGDSIEDVNDLYSTLAHEGYPGHLYQFTYEMSRLSSPLRSVLTFLGYSEGWGMYSEISALEWSGLSEEAAQLHSIYTRLGYIEDAWADLGVNGLGWTEKQLGKEMNRIGLNPDGAEYIGDYVMTYPGMILPYGIGLAEYMTLRENAEETLGASFNAKEFHTMLLEDGTVPIRILEENYDSWISEKKGGTQTEKPSATETPKPTHAPSPVSQNASRYLTPLNIAIGCFGVFALVMLVLLIRRKRKDPLA